MAEARAETPVLVVVRVQAVALQFVRVVQHRYRWLVMRWADEDLAAVRRSIRATGHAHQAMRARTVEGDCSIVGDDNDASCHVEVI